ncbi:MAG: hypothetical protein GX574_03905 [Lentisphaerae bacterium]|nr:hypothetical protein [Lentisphaerota bacterium]
MKCRKLWLAAVLLFWGVGMVTEAAEVGAGVQQQRLTLPDEWGTPILLGPGDQALSWQDIETAFHGGNQEIRAWVHRVLQRGDSWAARPDSYYVSLFRPETPFGSSTICCPFHPEESGWVPFKWDPEYPWRLTCPRCEKEKREPAYYPNKLYPDNGEGCKPSDKVWADTHDAAWGRKYNIPHEKWDGHTHGHIDSYAFFFIGHCQYRIFFELTHRNQILGSLCRAYLLSSKLFAKDSPEGKRSEAYAAKAKLIMVTMTRAIMGDQYLQAVLGMTDSDYRNAVRLLAADSQGKPLPYNEYPGYKERDPISDHSDDNPDRPLKTLRPSWRKSVTFYPGGGLEHWAGVWLPCYAMLKSSFTQAEQAAGLDKLVERLLVSEPDDEVRLQTTSQKLRRGVAELVLKPYGTTMRGNLAGGQLQANLNLGIMLKDQAIIKNMLKALYDYLHGGYFTADGLGYETSPHYTHVALSNLLLPLKMINGMSEGFGPEDPFWDEQSKSLNPYLDPALEKAAYSTLLSVLPDGRCAPWTDSWVNEKPSLGLAALICDATGRIPEQFAPFLEVERDPGGKTRLQLKKQARLPSYVLPHNGMAVMRMGAGEDQSFVSVDWSRATGHSHFGPFNLLYYTARHEVLFDQGYLNNVTPTQDWMGSAEAHNTALVRMNDGNAGKCITWRGKLRFFADTPAAKAVEVAEDMDVLRKSLPGNEPLIYQRTVILLELTPGAKPATCVVDIFRLQGGKTHDYYIHAMGEKLELTTPTTETGKSLYDLSGFRYKTKTGAAVIANVAAGQTDGDFSGTWSDLREWNPPSMDHDTIVKIRFLGAPGTEIFAGDAPGQRYIDARDIESRVNVLCVRRQATDYKELPNAFVTVSDAFQKGNEVIKEIAKLDVISGDPAAIGLRITHAGGTTYVCSTTRDDAATVFRDVKNNQSFTLTGRLGVAVLQAGKPMLLTLLNGTGIKQ